MDEWRNADVRAGGLAVARNGVVPSPPLLGLGVSGGWTATRYGRQYEGQPLGCGASSMDVTLPVTGGDSRMVRSPQSPDAIWGSGVREGVYRSADPAIVAVGPDADIPCGTLLWVCNPNAARLGSRAPTDRVGVGLREPPTPCILGVRADYCPGCRENHIDLSEAGINILAGLAPDGSEGQADRLTGLSVEVLK